MPFSAYSLVDASSHARTKSSSLWDTAVAPLRFVLILPHAVLLALVGATTMLALGVKGALLAVPGLSRLVRWWNERVSGWAIAAGRHLLADERDWPMLPVLCFTTLIVPASYALQLVDLGVHWTAMGALHLAVLLGPRASRFIEVFSIKHNEAHRRHGLFAPPWSRILGRYVECFLGIFYGNIPGSDHINHVKAHHAEDGGPDDHQTTLGLDRTSLVHFFRYVAIRHILTTLAIRPLIYFWRRGKRKDFFKLLAGATLFYTYMGAMFWVDWRVAVVVVGLPMLTNNLIGALATWLQHAFHDPDARDRPVLNTVTLTFDGDFLNEGYHLAHHHRAACHWTAIEACFQAWCDQNPRVEPIVIHGVDWLDLWLLIYVRRRFDLLAERWRPIRAEHASYTLDERIRYLKLRLQVGA